MPKLKEMLFGKKSKVKTQDLRTEEQKMLQDLINEGLSKGTGPFADIFGQFNKEEFDKGVTEPALKNFQENVLPQLQEQFIAGNATAGSGMQRAQGKAATDLQSKLAELMYGAQQQQKQNKMGGLQLINQAQGKQSYVKEGNKGALNALLEGFAGAAGRGFSSSVQNMFTQDSGSGGGGGGNMKQMAAAAAPVAG